MQAFILDGTLVEFRASGQKFVALLHGAADGDLIDPRVEATMYCGRANATQSIVGQASSLIVRLIEDTRSS